MVILEGPFTSDILCASLAERNVPVLRNAVAVSFAPRHCLRLLDDASFADGLAQGARLYTNNENALAWVLAHDPDSGRVRGVRLMKDKHAFREALRPLYPDFPFRRCALDALPHWSREDLPFPFVLKPSVGFFSMGVFVITDGEDWTRALDTIRRHSPQWRHAFAEGVIGDAQFTLEAYIEGDEYAIDAYYDDQGRAVVLNVMEHVFASASDVRDRLYTVRPKRMAEWVSRFEAYLDRIGAVLGLRRFPFHAEVRVAADGAITPIEFNPLRFAGCCTTDLAHYALGVDTCRAFLDGVRPDWERVSATRGDDIFSLILLDKPDVPLDGRTFDFAALRGALSEVLAVRPFAPESSAFGYVFARTPEGARAELDAILRSDLTEFLRPAP